LDSQNCRFLGCFYQSELYAILFLRYLFVIVLAIRNEIDMIETGKLDKHNNPLKVSVLTFKLSNAESNKMLILANRATRLQISHKHGTIGFVRNGAVRRF